MVRKLEEKIMDLEEGSCMDALALPLHGSLPPEMQVIVILDYLPSFISFVISICASDIFF